MPSRTCRPGRLKGLQGIALALPRSVKAAALSASLVLSALLTAVALRSPDCHWLAWISFLPLFVAVRWLGCPVHSRGGGQTGGGCPVPSRGGGRNRSARRSRDSSPSPTLRDGGGPIAAALAGGSWGSCLYLFCSTGPVPVVSPSAWLLALLIVIPTVYVGLAAWPARAMGFNLLTLALGWVLIEAVLHLHNSSSPDDGLLTGWQAEGPHLHWLARLLGYVSTAFVVACVNASLVGILSSARLSFPAYRSLAGSPNAGALPRSQVVLAIQSWTFHQTYPRAPPVRVAAVS